MAQPNDPLGGISSESLNEQVKATIRQRLGQAGHRGLRGIAVRVDSDRVVLTGTVASYFLKQVAQETVRHACPKCRVYNELDVAHPA